MEGVQFNEDHFAQKPSLSASQQGKSKMAAFLVKAGLAKDDNQGNIILIVCAVLFLAISLYLFLKPDSNSTVSKPFDQMTPAEKQRIPEGERAFLENINKQAQ